MLCEDGAAVGDVSGRIIGVGGVGGFGDLIQLTSGGCWSVV